MTAQLSELAKKIRSNALEEKRSFDDYDRMLKALGLFDAFSQINLSLGPSKVGPDDVNFFCLADTKEVDRQLKAAFKFCGLSEEQPRHWRALLNALVAECFPKKGRTKTRDEQGLFELLLDIHKVQAANPKLIDAKEISQRLLHLTSFRKKYPTINSAQALTKLVRKAQNPKYNHYVRYREEKDIALYVMREEYRAIGIGDEVFERGLRPVVEVALSLGRQRAQEDRIVERLKKKHLEAKGSACSWDAEQYYRQFVKEELEEQFGALTTYAGPCQDPE